MAVTSCVPSGANTLSWHIFFTSLFIHSCHIFGLFVSFVCGLVERWLAA
jgi:hypothetical protein